MRWSAVFLKAKWRRSLVKGGRFGAAGHGASPTTTNADPDEPIHSPLPQHQTYTGFGALPLDLFVSILKFAISVVSEFSPTYDVRALLANTVCRHWRWAALNTPSLWAYIPSCMPLSFVQLFPKRSGDAPLHVEFKLVWNSEDPRRSYGTSWRPFFVSPAGYII